MTQQSDRNHLFITGLRGVAAIELAELTGPNALVDDADPAMADDAVGIHQIGLWGTVDAEIKTELAARVKQVEPVWVAPLD
jgi:hypothetical protein